MVSIEPTTYAKTPHAINIEKMENIFSFMVYGTTSPYPTVVIVVKAQYKLITYLSKSLLSYTFAIVSQQTGSVSSSIDPI